MRRPRAQGRPTVGQGQGQSQGHRHKAPGSEEGYATGLERPRDLCEEGR